MRTTPAETWDFLIERIVEKEDLTALILESKEQYPLIQQFLGEAPPSEGMRAFLWYLLYSYPLVLEQKTAVSAMVDGVLARAVSVAILESIELSTWECMLNTPHTVTVPQDKKVIISGWLQAKGLGEHAEAIGL